MGTELVSRASYVTGSSSVPTTKAKNFGLFLGRGLVRSLTLSRLPV
jgi:hypothetical protein